MKYGTVILQIYTHARVYVYVRTLHLCVCACVRAYVPACMCVFLLCYFISKTGLGPLLSTLNVKGQILSQVAFFSLEKYFGFALQV